MKDIRKKLDELIKEYGKMFGPKVGVGSVLSDLKELRKHLQSPEPKQEESLDWIEKACLQYEGAEELKKYPELIESFRVAILANLPRTDEKEVSIKISKSETPHASLGLTTYFDCPNCKGRCIASIGLRYDDKYCSGCGAKIKRVD